MVKEEGPKDGSVYHYRAGEIKKIIENVAIPNATCFSPDGRIAYFTDTPTKKILKCATDPETGLPVGEWELFADVSDHRGWPDGAVVDSEGYLWNARWGGSCVVRHAPDGSIDRIIEVPVSQVTCPAFGGKDLKTLFITTAAKTLTPEQLAAEKVAGGVFAIEVDVAGLPETPIKL
jgi:sugar lactone lactonase YvrE